MKIDTLKFKKQPINLLSYNYLMPEKQDNSEITLGVLTAVEKNSRITQRDVAKNIGVALGLTNTYLKRCIKKGLIKVQQVPANRYAYFLTPRGFAEKSRLTAEYLSQGFQFFRVARNQLIEIFRICQKRNFKRIVSRCKRHNITGNPAEPRCFSMF